MPFQRHLILVEGVASPSFDGFRDVPCPSALRRPPDHAVRQTIVGHFRQNTPR